MLLPLEKKEKKENQWIFGITGSLRMVAILLCIYDARHLGIFAARDDVVAFILRFNRAAHFPPFFCRHLMFGGVLGESSIHIPIDVSTVPAVTS